MEITIGLLIIAIGAFCQSSCYVPINKIKDWSWESYWIVQGVFAWLLLPLLGACLAVPDGHSLFELFNADSSFNVLMTMLFGVLWGVGGLTFGLSMRYLGVALGQSIALGTCAGLGTTMATALMNPARSAMASPFGKLKSFTASFFCSSESEDAFMLPARPMTAIPTKVTTTPMITDAVSDAKAFCSGKKIFRSTGPMMVPRPAHVPRAILCPRATPR